MSDVRNVLAQPNQFKWRDNPPRVKGGDMRAAMACASKADTLECDCWNTKCPHHGDCRKCMVYETCLNQVPTCERDLLEELTQHKEKHSRA